MVKEKIRTWFMDEFCIAEESDAARELYNQSRFGDMSRKKVKLSLIEVMYLLDKDKIVVLNKRDGEIPFDKFFKKAKKVEPNIWIKFCVFKDLRDRGYIVKTALKFGADFRVYDRGVKPGEDHARWVVYAVHEGSTMTWHDFSAKNRVAHSTKKKLLIGIVDNESDVTYYEIKWKRP